MGPQGIPGPAGPAGPQGPPGSTTVAAFVSVSADATRFSGQNILGVTKLDKGSYRVRVARSESEGCALVATLDAFRQGEITATAVDQLSGDVLVRTYASGRGLFDANAPEDFAFSLAVFCVN
jgi:hypothetical protein